MTCDVGEETESLENEQNLRHNSFSNPSVALPTSQLILQSFRCFTYATARSPTLLSLLLRHRFFIYVTWRAAHGSNSPKRQKPRTWASVSVSLRHRRQGVLTWVLPGRERTADTWAIILIASRHSLDVKPSRRRIQEFAGVYSSNNSKKVLFLGVVSKNQTLFHVKFV